MLKDISHATVWDNLSTGVVLDAGTLSGPGRSRATPCSVYVVM